MQSPLEAAPKELQLLLKWKKVRKVRQLCPIPVDDVSTPPSFWLSQYYQIVVDGELQVN